MKPLLFGTLLACLWLNSGCDTLDNLQALEQSRNQVANQVTKTDAIAIASKLQFGMREDDAVRFLYKNGLTIDVAGAGDRFGWSHNYPLADGSDLVLEMHPYPFSSAGTQKNGRLEGAFIARNGTEVASIRLPFQN